MSSACLSKPVEREAALEREGFPTEEALDGTHRTYPAVIRRASCWRESMALKPSGISPSSTELESPMPLELEEKIINSD